MEKQFKRLIDKAASKKGDTEEILMSLLETRLDNIVYRLGFTKSRTMARQLVSHRHVLVNNEKINIPSYSVKVNDVITLTSKIKKTPAVIEKMEEKDIQLLPFLVKKGDVGKLLQVPKKES